MNVRVRSITATFRFQVHVIVGLLLFPPLCLGAMGCAAGSSGSLTQSAEKRGEPVPSLRSHGTRRQGALPHPAITRLAPGGGSTIADVVESALPSVTIWAERWMRKRSV